MLNDGGGRIFRVANGGRYRSRGPVGSDAARILVVDSLLSSRVLLAQAVAKSGYGVDTASNSKEARTRLGQTAYALVVVDHGVDDGQGLELLAELRRTHSRSLRALVTEDLGIEVMRKSIDRAELAFVLTKPWVARSVRDTIREVLGGYAPIEGWSRLRVRDVEQIEEPGPLGAPDGPSRRHEFLLRGLLAGLNSCESESEVFELLHLELSGPFRVRRWLWVDEETGSSTRIAEDWPVESSIPAAALSSEETRLLAEARKSLRVTRLAEEARQDGPAPRASIRLGVAIRSGTRRTMTGVVWAEPGRAIELVGMLRELQGGLQMAFHRIREADARAVAARELAERVSAELRTPVGALTHAINRLRGEVERAGMPTEWVDRVSSESERVIRAVEHLEGEMLSGSSRNAST